MRVFAYCCKSFAEGTRKAAGVKPLTCPPAGLGVFRSEWLQGYDLLYFDLHGSPLQDFWCGDDGIVALTAGQIRSVDLTGTIVFAHNCYLADEGSGMLNALLDAGARYVIGGEGKNWAGERSIFGASLLGLWFRRLLNLKVPPLKALAISKQRLRLSLIGKKKGKRLAAKDTLAFRAYYREGAI